MKELRLSSPFKKDLKRITRRGYDRALLDAVVDLLRDGEELPPARRDHALKGEWISLKVDREAKLPSVVVKKKL